MLNLEPFLVFVSQNWKVMATSMTGERIMEQLSFFKCYPLGFAELSLVCWPQLNPLRNYNICPSIWHKPLNTSRYSGEMCRRKN